MKNSPTILFYLIIVLFVSNMKANDNTPPLIPLPERVEWRKETFLLSENVEITSASNNLQAYFIERVRGLTGMNLQTQSGHPRAKRIIFRIDSLPGTSSKEAYELSVSEQLVEITGSDEEGIFRGMQTFFQLIPPTAKAAKRNEHVEIPCVKVSDHSAFSWRGLNLDCSRHFMTKDFIKRYIDILAYYKFNTFHWHLTEDQGWRIEIKKYPKLTEIGAWRKEADGSIYGGYYTQKDVKEIVAYAKSRFITVVPEIEMPGHSLASLASYPEHSCTGGPFEVTNIWGVIKDVYCAGSDSTFLFLQGILDEVTELFPGEYIHIGGDEVPKDRWKDCTKCQARMNIEGLKDEHELQSYFIKRIARYLESKGKKMIGWDEILEGGLAPGAIVQSWQSFQGALEAAKLGHATICSPASHTYLNHDPEDLDLRIAYSFNPVPDELSGDEKNFIIGGEANLWTEHAPQETVDSKLFPRLLALAEVFWRNPQPRNYEEFHARIQHVYADLAALGIQYGRESKVMTYSTSFDTERAEFILNISSGQQDVQIRSTINGNDPETNSPLYTGPIKINTTSSITFAAFRDGHALNKKVTLSFAFHKGLSATMTILHPYDERYRAAGTTALVDGIRGSNNFRDGLWQGYEGVDFEGIIDLGEEKEISKVVPRFMLNSTSWIFLPEQVTVSLSKDNSTFENVREIKNDVEQKNPEIILKDFPFEFSKTSARYIKVKAVNMKVCPPWHPGAGGKAWLFLDEIVVE